MGYLLLFWVIFALFGGNFSLKRCFTICYFLFKPTLQPYKQCLSRKQIQSTRSFFEHHFIISRMGLGLSVWKPKVSFWRHDGHAFSHRHIAVK